MKTKNLLIAAGVLIVIFALILTNDYLANKRGASRSGKRGPGAGSLDGCSAAWSTSCVEP